MGEQSRRATILLVDDCVDYLTTCALLFQNCGFEVIVAQSGAQALSEMRNHRPSVIVTDVGMPGMDGWELCRRLRSIRHLQRVPIIVVSAGTGMDVPATRCFDEYMSKPVQFPDLLGKVQAWLPLVDPAASATSSNRL